MNDDALTLPTLYSCARGKVGFIGSGTQQNTAHCKQLVKITHKLNITKPESYAARWPQAANSIVSKVLPAGQPMAMGCSARPAAGWSCLCEDCIKCSTLI